MALIYLVIDMLLFAVVLFVLRCEVAAFCDLFIIMSARSRYIAKLALQKSKTLVHIDAEGPLYEELISQTNEISNVANILGHLKTVINPTIASEDAPVNKNTSASSPAVSEVIKCDLVAEKTKGLCNTFADTNLSSTSDTQRILRPKNLNANLYEDPHSPMEVVEFEEGSSDEYNSTDDEDNHNGEHNNISTTTKQKSRWKNHTLISGKKP
ncbi:uncharacterized protein LOC126740193 [Anthonomus grandis grandis]|uniref:uncharacterized protein LOC126740193 n=1 Tax=Anthonomus grandis grandis TaxID=2921223 RepID=UPI002166BA39|nr:uncharacterized protein LOC126740193 [Anthonomus grandis grandis]